MKQFVITHQNLKSYVSGVARQARSNISSAHSVEELRLNYQWSRGVIDGLSQLVIGDNVAERICLDGLVSLGDFHEHAEIWHAQPFKFLSQRDCAHVY